MEFGSDFHCCEYPIGRSLLDVYPNSSLYIDGRQALIALVIKYKWNNVWIPSYYCYDFISSVKEYCNIEVYEYTPFDDISEAIGKIKYKGNDAIIIPNFFGASDAEYDLPDCVIIEDHSHDLISDWAINSKADWCFASIRKSLPVADGGILWSPKSLPLPPPPEHTSEGEILAEDRYFAMNLKAKYLNGEDIKKEAFRKLYISTENKLNILPISSISHKSYKIVASLDIAKWYDMKKQNWIFAIDNIIYNDRVQSICSINEIENKHPFAIVLKCSSHEIREILRGELIRNSIYPAVLWSIPNEDVIASYNLGETMLSIHCDGRYSMAQIKTMIDIINNIIICLK